MAGNNFRQPHRQGPPPQQQHFNDQYDQYEEMGYNGRQPNQAYNSRNQGYNEYRNDYYHDGNQQPFDNQYEPQDRWDDGHYQEPQYQDQYRQRPQNLNQGPPQQRSYQYDDRYRANGQNRPMPQNQYGRPPPRSGDERQLLSPQDRQYGNMPQSGAGQYNAGGPMKQPRARERILQPQAESPPTASWDNPFPTFPSKKKQTDVKKTNSIEYNQDPAAHNMQPEEPQRPSTSHGNRQHVAPLDMDLARPRTSHSQRNVEPLRSPVGAPPMPFQQGPPGPIGQSSFPREAQPYEEPRPQPRRAMTGPAQSQSPENYGQFGQQHEDERRGQRAYNDYPPDNYGENPNHQARAVQRRPLNGGYQNRPQNQHSGNFDEPLVSPRSDAFNYDQQNRPPQRGYTQDHYAANSSQTPLYQQPRKPVAPAGYNGGPNSHRRQSSDQSYGRSQPPETEQYDPGSYRGVPLTKKVSADVPSPDAFPDSRNGEPEGSSGPSRPQPGVAYRKPTYESPILSQQAPIPAPQSHQYMDEGNSLASPLEQFSFELEGNNSPMQQPVTARQVPTQDYQRADAQRAQNGRMPTSLQDRPMQHPPRGVSRPQEFPSTNTHGHPVNRPPPFRPGLVQSPSANPNPDRTLQDYDQDRTSYDSGPPRDAGYDRPTMPPSQSSYHSEPSRQAYDPRLQPRPGFASPQLMPPRPATSNSARPGPNTDYGLRPSSDSQRWNGIQNPDSLPAHPAPFRPGLMQPTPPAPRPTPPPQAQYRPPPQQQPQQQPQPQTQPPTHQRAPSMPKPDVQAESPVTVGELNTLRQDYKNRPNDHALGLKFAKRLVEAAKVLSNEGGRADAKQTAKNRERYVLDAHKIVKRLCSSGYGEAMFYMADCYGQGLLGLEVDPKEAFSLYQSAAKLGHPQAAYRVAVCCELGNEEGGGTRRDPPKAVQWYKRAASLGDTPAMYKMGMIQLKGLLGQPKSPREAISWLKRAAERADEENPHALHELGLLYENAQSTDIILKDEKYALQLFVQAAELGYKYSQFRLGSAYEYGLLGLTIDPRMSIAWYSRAAKQGEHQSEFALSGWYLTGSTQASPGEQPLLPQSDTEAYLWARKAASSGLAKAEYAMGYYTEVGIGVASNIEEAKRWYYRAAAQNHPKARERLEDLKKGGQRMQKTRVSRSNVGKQNEGECTVM